MASSIDLFPARGWIPELSKDSLRADLIAALTAAILVLPQSIAFAAIAGMPIEHGLYTAIVTPIIAALFGSSRHMISGPTTAISVLVFASLGATYQPGSVEYVHAAILMTLMAGVFQLAMGLLRMGSLASFVSPSVMIGFTTGAAFIIFISQLPHVLGIQLESSATTVGVIQEIGKHASELKLFETIIGVGALLFAAALLWLAPGWPNYLLALLFASGLAMLLSNNGADIAFVSSIPLHFPAMELPEMTLKDFRLLAPAAFAIVLVGLLEAPAISRALAIKSDQEVDISQEFAGQGLSNIIGSFFSAYMGSGSFTRSAANLDSGARTPLAAVFASLILLLIVLLFGQWISMIPVAAVAGIILLVAIRLVSIRQIKRVISTSRGSTAVMGITFVATLLVGLEFSIIIGVFVSLSLFLRRSSMAYLAITAPDPSADRRRFFRNARAFDLQECPQMVCGRLDGQLYFGSVDDVRRQLRELERERPQQKNLLMLMKHLSDIDMAGSQLLIEESVRRRERGGRLFVTMRQRQVSDKYRRFGVVTAIGHKNVFSNKGDAIAAIVPALDQSICATCTKRVFNECPPAPEENTEEPPV